MTNLHTVYRCTDGPYSKGCGYESTKRLCWCPMCGKTDPLKRVEQKEPSK